MFVGFGIGYVFGMVIVYIGERFRDGIFRDIICVLMWVYLIVILIVMFNVIWCLFFFVMWSEFFICGLWIIVNV